MPYTESDIVTALSSSTTATTATLRIRTKAGTDATVDMPIPPTRICQYVPVPGGQQGTKSLIVLMCSGRAQTCGSVTVSGGGEGGSDGVIGEVWGSVPASPAASCPRMTHAFHVIPCRHRQEQVGGGC